MSAEALQAAIEILRQHHEGEGSDPSQWDFVF
jgi:hypothetical protein